MARVLEPVVLALLLAASVAGYLHLTSRYGMLPGIDGPYYAIQVRSLAETGRLKYPDPPLTFYVMYLAYKATGDLFSGVRFGVSLMTSVASIPIYLLVRRLTGSRSAGLASAIVFLVAPHEFRLLGDFMKNSSGLVWLSAYLLLAHRSGPLDPKRRVATYVYCLALFMLAGLTHVLVYGFMVVYTVLLVALQLLVYRDRREPFYEGAAALALSLAVFYAYPDLQGGDLGKAFNIAGRVFSSITRGALAGLLQAQGLAAPSSPPWSSQFLLLDWLAAILLLVESYILYRRDYPRYALGVAALGLTLLSFTLPLIPRQYLFRFDLMGGVPLAVALGLVVGLLGEGIMRILTAVAVVGLVLVPGLSASSRVAPSVPPEAYHELQAAVDIVSRESPDACYLARNVRLRYWLETLVSSVNEEPGTCYPLVVIDYVSRQPPPQARVLFRGRFVIAWTR